MCHRLHINALLAPSYPPLKWEDKEGLSPNLSLPPSPPHLPGPVGGGCPGGCSVVSGVVITV